MTRALDQAVRALREIAPRFETPAHAEKHSALQRAASQPLVLGAALPRYHEVLLFLAAHPSDARMRALVERELARLAAFLKATRGRHPARFEGEGLPWVDTVTRFTHDCVRWLLGHAACRVETDSYNEPTLDLNAVLRLTLPSLERSETTADLGNDDLLDALRVRPSQRLEFVVNELARLDAWPAVKDLLFDKLELYVRVKPRHRAFSNAGNRLPMRSVFYQRDLLRRFDATALMNRRLPRARVLDAAARAQAVDVLKTTMALTSRETDPATYLDARSLRIFDLDRGLAVAVFGMTPERQLPLESYVGFTLFKNGLPVAYGGAWLLGPRSNFGMNIFEPYRGGESGYMMCQVLRVYRQAFGVRFFEVDAHQFGLDNPDGIATGAYWFYYRYGFRSLDPALARLALRERQRIEADARHRSSHKTLLTLTGSNVALNFGGPVPTQLFDITTRVTRLVQRRYDGDRAAAERDCVKRFSAQVRLPRRLDDDGQRVLIEVALVAEALAIDDAAQRALLAAMIRAKPRDLFAYQRLLLRWLGDAPRPGAAA
jgi:hypothetical protein